MCRHSAVIHTCDCEPKTTFRKCVDQLEAESRSKKKDFKPLECPNYFRKPSVRVEGKCCNCLAFDLVIEQSFEPKQLYAYNRRRISLDRKGREKIRSKQSGRSAIPSSHTPTPITSNSTPTSSTGPSKHCQDRG